MTKENIRHINTLGKLEVKSGRLSMQEKNTFCKFTIIGTILFYTILGRCACCWCISIACKKQELLTYLILFDLPLSFGEYYSNIDHSYGTRTHLNSEFSLPRPRTELGKQSIKYAGVKIWSEIPLDIKSSDKLQVFSDKFKSHILQKLA